MNINIYVIEDDPSYREKFTHLLKNYNSKYFNVMVTPIINYVFFMENLYNFTILDNDVFFLDIDLKTYFSGVELAKNIRKINDNCTIIFLTGLQDKAITIINSNISPLGYIVKDFEDSSDINETVHSILLNIEKKMYHTMNSNSDILCFSDASETFYINSENIFYMESCKGVRGKIFIKTNSEELVVEGKISDLKVKLKQPYFCTSLKSYIINIMNISSIDKKEGTVTFLNNADSKIKLDN